MPRTRRLGAVGRHVTDIDLLFSQVAVNDLSEWVLPEYGEQRRITSKGTERNSGVRGETSCE